MRFYFVIDECGDVTDDHDGMECRDLADAEARATASARAIMCDEIARGHLCLSCFIRIEDERHQPVSTIRFSEVVAVTGR